MATPRRDAGYFAENPVGHVVAVDVSATPSAETSTMVFSTVTSSAMACPGATAQHCSANSLPSADSEGNPDVLCQMKGACVGTPPVAREHSPLGRATELYADPGAHGEISSR